MAGALAERPAHGFELARIFAADGPLGLVWTVRRQQIYRALNHLEAAGAARAAHSEESPSGPTRTVYELTEAGRRDVDAWLARPVERLRDVRHVLLLKLALSHRRGRDVGQLVRAQRAEARRMARLCRRRLGDATGPERIVLAWRAESAEAVLRLLEDWPPDE